MTLVPTAVLAATHLQIKDYTMNEFINRNSEGIILVAIIALLLSAVLVLHTTNNYHTQAMADKGYVEQALPGTTTTIWVKDNARY